MTATSAEPPARGPEGHPLDSVPSTARTRPPVMIRHGRCGKSWTGANRGHCSGCHDTFTSGAFDKHQHISAGTVTCSTDGLIGKPQPWGTLWTLPDDGRARPSHWGRDLPEEGIGA